MSISFQLIYILFLSLIFFITCAGLPTTTELSGMDFTTTEPAPIMQLSPIVIPPIITTLAPHKTLSPIIGVFPFT